MPDSVTGNFRKDLFLTSDWHRDSIYCDTKLLIRDLEYAKNNNMWIIINGDTFDAMQGKKDPRGRLDELRPELKTERYFDVLVDMMVQFLEPYHNNILLVAKGNHDLSVIKHNGTDLVERTIGALNNGKQHRIQTGGYGGWIRFMFQHGKVSRGRLAYRYHHGKGANAFVSDGIMDDKRAGVSIPDADIVHFGHNHKEYVHTVARERLNGKGQIEYNIQLYVRTPGYQSAYIKDTEGLSWAYTFGAPTPLGSVSVSIGFVDNRPKIINYVKTF